MGPMISRKWLILFLSSSLGLALCSWLYYHSSSYFGWNTGKRTSPLLRAWLWLRTFLVKPSSSSSNQNPPQTPSQAPIAPQLGWNSAPSASSAANVVDSVITNLYERRVSGSPRIVVLSTRQILFSDGEGDQITWIPQALESLQLWYSKRRALDLYLITQCQEDETEQTIRKLLLQAKIQGLNMDKVLFCATTAGLQHMARQLTPDLYIDASVDNLVAGERWAKSCILLGSDFPQAYSSLYELVNSL